MGQKNVQMPHPIVGFVCPMLPSLRNNRRRLLSSLTKLANTCLLAHFMMMPLLLDLGYYKNPTLILKPLKMT